MKKLFFFLSLALAVVLTGCENDNKSQPVEVPKVPVEEKNTGDENIVYTYFLGTKALCGETIEEVATSLSKLNFQSPSDTEFILKNESYSVNVTLVDDDDDKVVDILAVSIEPSEKEGHAVMLNQDVFFDFVKQVKAEVKLLQGEKTACSFYGLYSMNGDQIVSSTKFEELAEGKVDAGKLSGSVAIWLDENIKEFKPFDTENPQEFTGMIVTPIQFKGDEFIVNFAFVNKRTIDWE